MRPTGVSNGGTMTDPPSSAALAAVASASSVPKYTCQWLGTPGICGGIEPPTIASPDLNTVYGWPSPMSMPSVVRPVPSAQNLITPCSPVQSPLPVSVPGSFTGGAPMCWLACHSATGAPDG